VLNDEQTKETACGFATLFPNPRFLTTKCYVTQSAKNCKWLIFPVVKTQIYVIVYIYTHSYSRKEAVGLEAGGITINN